MYGSTRLVFQKKIGTANCVIRCVNDTHFEYSILSAVSVLTHQVGKVWPQGATNCSDLFCPPRFPTQ